MSAEVFTAPRCSPTKQILPTACRIPVWPFVVVVKAENAA
jgi:hypothetical protein